MLYNNYYSSDYHLEKQLGEYSNCFDVSRIDHQIEYAKGYINDLQSGVKRCQEYISFLIRQKELAESIAYRYEVELIRQSYSKPIVYFAIVRKIPVVPNGDKKSISIESERFEGKDRHLAKKRAIELAKKYNCELIYNK